LNCMMMQGLRNFTFLNLRLDIQHLLRSLFVFRWYVPLYIIHLCLILATPHDCDRNEINARPFYREATGRSVVAGDDA